MHPARCRSGRDPTRGLSRGRAPTLTRCRRSPTGIPDRKGHIVGSKRRVNYRHAMRRRLPGTPIVEAWAGFVVTAGFLAAVLIIFGSPS